MRALLIFICFLWQATSKATITLPSIISSGMVMQQQSSVRIWGWGDATENVSVNGSWNNQSGSAKVDANGKWQVLLQTPVAGGPYTITIKGSNTIVLQNILIGEVWVCSGQSNMEMSYNWGLPQMKTDLPAAANANIRFFTVPHTTAITPQENGKGNWQACDSITVKSFSAAAYYFARKLNADLNSPIGIVSATWGGTPAEVWTPAEEIYTNPVLTEAARKVPAADGWPITPGFAYNGMIAPVTNFTIAGVIWYQGEGNTANAATYQPLFTTLIKSWRAAWKNDFPFYYVQLAPFAYGNKNVAALVREAQLKTMAVPKTGMAVITDLADDTTNIHPKNKRDVGLRLAALALHTTYGRKNENAVSPVYSSLEVKKNKLLLHFTTDAALAATNGAVTGVWVAGNDKKFYPALATIKATTIEVWSTSVAAPVAARYAFSNTAIGNIITTAGLPVSPFRTDDWDVDTSPVKK